MLHHLAALLTLLGPIVLVADDEDPIKAELDRARGEHVERVEEAKESLLAALVTKSDEAAARSDLEALKAIEAQRERFERDGTLPDSLQLRAAVAAYKRGLGSADRAFLQALERAKDEYTRAKKIEEADAVLREMQQHEPDEDQEDAPRVPTDALQPGTEWIGEVSIRFSRRAAVRTFPAKLLVLGRNDARFKARIEINVQGDGQQVREVIGTIQRGRIGWYARNVKVIKGTEGQDTSGTIRGDLIELAFGGLARGARRQARPCRA